MTLDLSRKYKIVTYVPESHANNVREALARAGAGKIDNYSHCTFSVKGITRFKPLPGSNPEEGEVGVIEESVEERIETFCNADNVENVLKAIAEAHPYETPATDVYLIGIAS